MSLCSELPSSMTRAEYDHHVEQLKHVNGILKACVAGVVVAIVAAVARGALYQRAGDGRAGIPFNEVATGAIGWTMAGVGFMLVAATVMTWQATAPAESQYWSDQHAYLISALVLSFASAIVAMNSMFDLEAKQSSWTTVDPMTRTGVAVVLPIAVLGLVVKAMTVDDETDDADKVGCRP